MKDIAGIKAILWDLDGTLQDSYHLILASFRHTTQTVLGEVIPDEVLMQKVGQPLEVQMWDFTDDVEVHAELLRVYREHNAATHDENLRQFPGTAEACKRLVEAGYTLGVVTSKFHKMACRGLGISGLEEYMSFVVGADDCPEHKPAPGPVIMGCGLAGFAPEECMFVGDSPFDMAAGRGAGCITVGALWGMFPKEALEAKAPDFMFENVTDFVNMVLGEFARLEQADARARLLERIMIAERERTEGKSTDAFEATANLREKYGL